MYYQESWYIVLCLRLHCVPFNKLMTSGEVVLDDFEEGEIVDDSDPPPSSCQSNFRNACSLLVSNVKPRPLFEVGNSKLPQRYLSNSPAQNDTRTPFTRRNGGQSVQNNRGTSGRTLRARRRRRRQRELRRQSGSTVSTSRPVSRSPFRNQRQPKVLPKATSSYEEKVRQQRIKSRSKSIERRLSRTKTNLVETQISGSSLLKRLVGSGSVGIKLLEENVSESDKASSPLNSSAVLCPSKLPWEDTTVPDNFNNSVNELPLADTMTVVMDHTNDTRPEIDKHAEGFKEPINVINETIDSSQDSDEELKLRMEALKTAVLKKHTERLKRGLVPKKISNKVDSFVLDSLIEEVESIDEFTSVNTYDSSFQNCDSSNLNAPQSECSDMSLDSNYVSDDENLDQDPQICLHQDAILSEEISGAKRSQTEFLSGAKRVKLDEVSLDSNSNGADNVLSDLTDEELQLRALALKSFLQRKALKDSDTESDKVSSQTEQLDLCNKETVPSESTENDKSNEKQVGKSSDTEDWEELDEDILRAQLLKTLSNSLPERTKSESSIDDNNTFEQSSSSSAKAPPSASKKESDIQLELQSRLWSEKMVPKLIISLQSDSESEAEPSPVDFVKSLDLLLQKAKEKSESNPSKTGVKQKIKRKYISPKEPVLKKGASSTPMAVKHLPIQQQEEYRRLKMKLAEKMKSSQSSKSNESSVSSTFPLPHPEKKNPVSHPQPSERADLSNEENKVGDDSVSKINPTPKVNTKSVNTLDNGVKVKKIVPVAIVKPAAKIIKKPNLTSFKAKLQPTLRNNTKIINRASSTIAQQQSLLVNKTLPKVNKIPCTMSNNLETSIRAVVKEETKNDFKTNTASHRLNSTVNIKKNTSDIIGDVNDFSLKKDKPSTGSTLQNPQNMPASFTRKKLVNESVKNVPSQVDKVSSKQGLNSNENCSADMSKVVCILKRKVNEEVKDNEGNSDKENNVMRNKIPSGTEVVNAINLDIKERSSAEADSIQLHLMTKLKEAQSRYKETLSLVSRLEKELQEAKRILRSHEKIVSDLKEQIESPNGPSSEIVKLQEEKCQEEMIGGVVTAEQTSTQFLSKKNECWDPDGVLCPFQLSGSCKDPHCTYHHIPSS